MKGTERESLLLFADQMAYTPADLETAERHVAQTEWHIARQEALVSRLRLKGLPTEDAERLLSTYRSFLELHREHRDVIETQVRESTGS